MLIPNKYDGYSRDGRRLYYFGGDDGGGAAAPSDKTTQVSELPEWARPYAKDTLAKGAALTDINQNPYQTYGANRIAGFSPMQQRSMQAAAYMQPSQQLGTATDLASAAGIGALGINYQPGQFSNQFTAPTQFSAANIKAPGLQNYQMTGPANVASEKFGQQAVTDYMSPYMQSVVGVQQREAQRQSDIAGTQRNAQAAQAGAFGGSRQAIMNAEAARNLATQKGDIQAQGLQSAYGQAQQQFNADQAQRMQAALANQGMGFNVGSQNLQANLGVQQLGAGQNLQAQQANEQSRQYGAGLDMTSAQQKAQYGQAAQQLGEQSKQFGANLGLQGLQTALQGAGQLGQLGGQQFQQSMDINKLQNLYGGQSQQQAQRYLDQDYQDFQNQQNYPYKQLGFMSDMIRGLPLGQQSTSSVYSQGPGAVQTLAGLGGAAYGFGKSGLFAEGGEVKTYAGDRGSVTSQDNKDSIVEGMYSMEGLRKAKQAALARRDVDTAEAIDERIAELNAIQAQSASIDRGLGSAYDQIPEDRQEEMMYGANGGIVAFAGGGTYGKRFEESLNTFTGMQPPKSQTPEEFEQGAMKRLPMLERMMGPDVTAPFAEELKAEREKLPAQMEKDQGLAIAMASLGLLARNKKPGESRNQQLISGIGEAGLTFAGEVGRLKKENREADNKIRQSQLLIATAQQQRKEGMAGKAIASQEKAEDKIQDAFKTKAAIQEKATQLIGDQAKTEAQGENALRVAGIQAAVHRETANKPGEFERMLSDYEKRVGRKLSPEEYKQAMTEIGAARYGAKYSGPDRSPEQATGIRDKALKDGRVTNAELAIMMARDDPVKKQAAQDEYNRILQEVEQEIISRADAARAQKRTDAGAPGKSVADVGRTPDPEAVNILKSAPSTRNRKYFDDVYGAGAAARVLGN
jgi:hypothetical protein